MTPDGGEGKWSPATLWREERFILRSSIKQLTQTFQIVVVAAGCANRDSLDAIHAGDAFVLEQTTIVLSVLLHETRASTYRCDKLSRTLITGEAVALSRTRLGGEAILTRDKIRLAVLRKSSLLIIRRRSILTGFLRGLVRYPFLTIGGS